MTKQIKQIPRRSNGDCPGATHFRFDVIPAGALLVLLFQLLRTLAT
jgi:hypothetical protein